MTVRKFCVMVLLALPITITATAQERDPFLPSAKTIYGELGGPGVLSLNYDQRFKGEKGLGFRIGIGGLSVVLAGIFTIPVGINYLDGADGHYFELGAGLSGFTAYNGSDFFKIRNSTLIGYFTLGYRYQPEKTGFTGRIFVSPLITPGGFYPIYGGISVGKRL